MGALWPPSPLKFQKLQKRASDIGVQSNKTIANEANWRRSAPISGVFGIRNQQNHREMKQSGALRAPRGLWGIWGRKQHKL